MQMLNNRVLLIIEGLGKRMWRTPHTPAHPSEKGVGPCLLMVSSLCPMGITLEVSRFSMNRNICVRWASSSLRALPFRSFKPQTTFVEQMLQLTLVTCRNRSTEKLRKPVQGDTAAK